MSGGTTQSAVASRLAVIRERIADACARAGRSPGDVSLIAVTKTWPPVAVEAAFAAGVRDFGENRVQEALPKMDTVDAGGARWHLIGHLQTNKVRSVAGRFAILHAVESTRLLDAIAATATTFQPVFIQVNVSGEASKFGIEPRQLDTLLEHASGLERIAVEGLMTVPPLSAHAEDSRQYFRTLRELADRHGLFGLSMGMTNDYEVAIEEGATHVRVGRAIFGDRS